MSNLIRRTFPLGFLAALALAGAGCGQRELPKPETYPVHGKVLWHGEPVRFAMISLEPADPSQGGAPAIGTTGVDGTFTVRTFSNSGEPDGAIPGEYKVQLEDYDVVRAGPLPAGARPTKIGRELDTGVTVQVKAEDNDLTIQVP
jgi:hypothetical protein